MSDSIEVKANTEEATRVQLGADGEEAISEEQLDNLAPQIRTGQGTTIIQRDKHGEVHHVSKPDATSYQMGRDNPDPTDILSTARHPQTGRPASEITGKTLVNVGGMETSIDAAVSSGYLRRTASGGYEEVGDDNLKSIAEAKAEAQATAEALQAEHTIDLGDFNREFKADAEEALGEIEVGRMVNDVLMGKEITDETIRNHARKMAMEPEHFHSYMSGLIDTVQSKVDSWVEEHGDCDPQSFYSWLRDSTPAHELSSRINYLVQTGDVRKALGEKLLKFTKTDRVTSTYDAELDAFNPDVEEVTYNSDGEQMVIIKGVTMRASDARKWGLLD